MIHLKIYFFTVLIAYLLGSFSPSVLLGKYIFKQDLRRYGSKNPGTSNTVYVYGYKAGVFVFLLDVLKGFAAILLADRLFGQSVSDHTLLLSLASFAAVLGHCQSLFLKFKGGKGLATVFGVYLYQFPMIALGLLTLFVAIVFISKYVTVGTFTVITLYPIIQAVFYGRVHSLAAIVLMFLTSIFIWYRHRENFVRLLKGTEISIRTPRINESELGQ